MGITGSTGKTGTKDMLYHMCTERYRTGRTIGNLNNHIGLPLTVLSFDEGIEVAVLEMGTEEIGEIRLLADIARPDIGIITNIGTAHLGTFGSRENIFRGKMEIRDFFDDEGVLIVNGDNDMLSAERVSGHCRVISVSEGENGDYRTTGIKELGVDGIEFTVEHGGGSRGFRACVLGRHNAVNATLAVAAAMELGVSMEEARRGLMKMPPAANRLNVRAKGEVTVINDAYNASPDSVKSGVATLLSFEGKRKVAVIGDMLGLGEHSRRCHEETGEWIAESGVDLLVLTGESARHMADKAMERMGSDKVIYYSSRECLENEVRNLIADGDAVLVKGSRAMAMERVAEKLLE